MLRSKCRSLLLLLLRSPTRLPPSKTLALISSPIPKPNFISSPSLIPPLFSFCSNHSPSRFLSSSAGEAETTEHNDQWSRFENEEPSSVDGEFGVDPTEKLENEDRIAGEFGDDSVQNIEQSGEFVKEIDVEQLESVVAILRDSGDDSVETQLEKMESLTLSDEFVVRAMMENGISGGNLVSFYTWASKNGVVKTVRAVEVLVHAVTSDLKEIDKKVAYKLWDLLKELGKEKGLLKTEILNELIAAFAEFGKGNAALEVFNKFDDFGCGLDSDSYYFTIKALGRRLNFEAAWSVCEKMLSSGRVPDREKIGDIIKLLGKGKMAKEAHLVYLMAKDNQITPLRSTLDSLISGLSRDDDTVRVSLELLDDYPGEPFKYANKTFSSVVKGLCRIKDFQEAKKLLIRMVDSGPPPGSAAFNFVITALSKGGEMEDAVSLMRIMEKRGLRPDVYTYTVIMSGFVKGGLMDEARKFFDEAKEKHSKLSSVTYHILTRGYCKMEMFDKALEFLKEMKDNGMQPNTDEYNKMIKSLCLKALDWRTAENLLAQMKDSGLYLAGTTRSLISAVKELEENEMQSAQAEVEA